jgi:hypothetical protein
MRGLGLTGQTKEALLLEKVGYQHVQVRAGTHRINHEQDEPNNCGARARKKT